MKRTLYFLWHAVIDMFPMSFYGASGRERFASFAHCLKHWMTPALNILTVTVSIVTILVVASIYEGGIRWIRENISENPLATRITFAKQSGGVPEFTRLARPFQDQLPALEDEERFDTKLINPRELAFLSGPFSEAVGSETPFVVKGAYGWSDMQLWLLDSEGLADKRGHTTGQILQNGDPLLANLEARPTSAGAAVEFTGEGEGQIVITERLLSHLGYGDLETFRQTDGKIRVKYARRFNGDLVERDEELRVVGVASALPYGEYVITESFGRAFRSQQWSPTPYFEGARVGPIPIERETLETKLSGIAGYLRNNRVTGVVETVDESVFVDLTRRSRSLWARERWTGFLERVAEKLELEFDAARQIAWSDPLRTDAGSSVLKGYMNCSMDVSRVEEVPAAADALYGLGFNVKSSAKDQALLLIQLSKFGRGLLAAIIGIVGVLSVIGIGLSFAQTIQRKTKEIGIFKAFGSNNAEVAITFLFQAALIWAIAFGIAAASASMLGGWAAEGLAAVLKLDLETRSLARLSDRALGFTAVGTFLLCMIAVALGGSLALRLQPAHALRSL